MPESTEYLYLIRPARIEMLSQSSTPEEDAIVAEHFAYLQRALADGVLILAGRTLNTDDKSFGIVVFRAASEEQARAVVEHDPAVRAGVMQAELYPYRVALLEGRD